MHLTRTHKRCQSLPTKRTQDPECSTRPHVCGGGGGAGIRGMLPGRSVRGKVEVRVEAKCQVRKEKMEKEKKKENERSCVRQTEF